MTSYLTIAREGNAETEVAGSRFRCRLVRVEDELSARAVIEQERKQNREAGHHCAAYLIGPGGQVERSLDDGEPPGTAGAPMLEVLRAEGLSDVVAVVTRWFGGALLGTGNLARAYAETVRAAVADAGTRERVLNEVCEVSVEHTAVGRLEHELRARGTKILGVEYADRATLRLAVPPMALATAAEIVAELTSGSAALVRIGQEWVDG
ncbi:MAG: IMPACT family protein [Actinomycetota bacterium]|nr:IMPACT family protein [Actinomycetota bacterium]